LVRELGRLGGVAASIVSIDARGIPEGLVAVHLGDSDLLRGLAETGLQVLPPHESLGEYATYRIPVEGVEIWAVQTSRLMLLSTSRDQVAAAVARLQSEDAPRLSQTDTFRNLASDRGDALVYAWADADRATPILEGLMRHEMRDDEFMIAQTLLGLRHLESASLSLGATDNGVCGEAAIRFKQNHQHLIYGLLRTAPIGQTAFSLTPKDAAVVAAFGLNPPGPAVPTTDSAAHAAPGIALMDIGRELFANVQSITVFAQPGAGPIPDVAAIVHARDGEKSELLWNQLLSLPMLFGALPPQSMSEIEVGGRQAKQYQFPQAPPIVVVQPNSDALLVGTAGAVEAALSASDTGVAVDQHPQLGPLVRQTSDTTSKAVYVSASGVMRCAQSVVGPRELREMQQIAPLVENLTYAFTVDEAPTQLSVQLEVSGLPKVSDALKTASGGRIAVESRHHVAPPVAVAVVIDADD
jgi:hypothetical protein